MGNASGGAGRGQRDRAGEDGDNGPSGQFSHSTTDQNWVQLGVWRALREVARRMQQLISPIDNWEAPELRRWLNEAMCLDDRTQRAESLRWQTDAAA